MTLPIQSLAHSLHLLRAELGEVRSQSTLKSTAQPQVNSGAPNAIAQHGSAVGRLTGRLQALSSLDGQVSHAKVLHAFVEAALLDEFGEDQQLDPAFVELVEKTCLALEASPGGAALAKEVVAELLGP